MFTFDALRWHTSIKYKEGSVDHWMKELNKLFVEVSVVQRKYHEGTITKAVHKEKMEQLFADIVVCTDVLASRFDVNLNNALWNKTCTSPKTSV
jgi:hypothetical protein